MTRRSASSWHIEIDRAACVQCAGCVSICPTQALDMHALDLQCEDRLCIGCDLCVRFCPVVALALEELPQGV
jgi:ferredoxin